MGIKVTLGPHKPIPKEVLKILNESYQIGSYNCSNSIIEGTACIGMTSLINDRQSISRRSFLKVGAVMVAGCSYFFPIQKANANPLIIAIIRTLAVIGVGVVSGVIANEVYYRWSQQRGGRIETTLSNPTNINQSGVVKSKLIDIHSKNTELHDNCVVEIPAASERPIKFRMDKLPYTGEKKFVVKTALSEVETQEKIVVY